MAMESSSFPWQSKGNYFLVISFVGYANKKKIPLHIWIRELRLM